jgi:hypothetical protein
MGMTIVPGFAALTQTSVDMLYVLTNRDLYLITGSITAGFTVVKQHCKAGSKARGASLGVPGVGIFHLGYDGIYLLAGSDDQKVTEQRFDPTFNGTTVGSLNCLYRTNIANCLMCVYKNHLYFLYPSGTATYCTDALVINLATQKTVHYSLGQVITAIAYDRYNERLIATDTSGYAWVLEYASSYLDGAAAISWQIETKAFADQMYKYFPRYAKYDVYLNTGSTATGTIYLNEASVQTHTLASRSTKKRLIAGCTGDRLSVKVNGTGEASVYMVEVE